MQKYHWKYGFYSSIYIIIAGLILLLFSVLKLNSLFGAFLSFAVLIIGFGMNLYLGKKHAEMSDGNYHTSPIGLSIIFIIFIVGMIGSATFLQNLNITPIFLVVFGVLKFFNGVFAHYWIPEKDHTITK
ncbi:hypothetical protein ABVF11_00580 [Pediococcus argentinicus]|uniref:hypothetical protein n=1 Tax=Pediococcus argentinicus TaxID=480391 RepID=UPI00338F2A76